MANYLTVKAAQVTRAEREALKAIASSVNREDAIIVNIGIMWGGSLWCLRAGAPKSKLYGIDLFPDKWGIEDKENLNAIIIQGDSQEVEFEEDIDLLFIDGDHHYATVKADIEHWVPKCKGILAFHDYNPMAHNLRQFPELEGVKRAVNEWFAVQVGWTELPAPDSLRIFKWQK